ncbi:MAG TPA: hypothetical protein VF032_19450 [Thermoleophilaceae bacterium]
MTPPAGTLPAQQGYAASPAAGQPAAVPFAQASHHGLEQGPTFTVTPGAAQQTFGPFPLPATGYLRRVIIELTTTTNGVAGTGAGDYPFNIFALLRLTDTNGAPIFELSGYNTLLADTYGGYAGAPDPRTDPDFSSSVTTPSIEPYIPLEIDPTGMGSPANLSASSAYRLTCVVDTSGNIWSAAPTTIPTFTVQVWCDYWTLPNPTDMQNRPQAIAPPYAGTIQLWSQQPNIAVNAGANRIALNRMGNLLRTVLCVFRSSGARSDAVIGDPLTQRWDDINLQVVDRKTLRKIMREYTNDLTARDTGVYLFGLYNYGIERNVGGTSVASWLPTVTATRYEVNTPAGSGGGGTLDFVINDVSVAATAPEQRAAVGGMGVGFHPPVAPVIPGAT